MKSKILTPISLWKQFDDSLPLQAQVLQEREIDGVLYRETRFLARQTQEGRVNVYGVEVRPVGEEKLHALLLLSEGNRGVDLSLAVRFARRGYCVFCMDYSGESLQNSQYTQYPKDVDYANFLRAERYVLHADEGAQKTAWYEWTAAAIYAVKYLKSLPYITSVGAMGVHEGGEIVWKLMTIVPLACGICINAAGWLADRNTYKFSENAVVDMAEEKRLFVAGIDSQSYAPFVKCPVLMLVSTTDKFIDADKAYDTYVRINKEQFSTIYYSVSYGGSIDKKGIKNADMFMDKYLKNRGVFIPRPLEISFEDDNNELCAVVVEDQQGESVADGVYFAEDTLDVVHREWIKCTNFRTLSQGKKSFPLPVYQHAEAVFAFVQSEYSSGFTASSKIAFKKIEKKYTNEEMHSNIIYDSSMSGECFSPVYSPERLLGGFLYADEKELPVRQEGYGKISGMACCNGLKTYRISRRRYAPQPRSLLHFNVYCEEDCVLTVAIIQKNEAGEYEQYENTVFFKGGGRWKKFLLYARNFKGSSGGTLQNFCQGRALQFVEEKNKTFIINNVLWV